MALPDQVISLLEKSPITLVDAGARNGVVNFPHLSKWIGVDAFEPDAEEASVLKNTKTPFASYIVHAFALSSTGGKRKFHLTRNRSFSSFLSFDREEFKKHFGRMAQSDQWIAGFETEHTLEIDCVTLDAMFSQHTLDYLKLDTQGTELEILNGAAELIKNKRISIIEVEVNMQPVYAFQPQFSTIDQFLCNAGFLLVDYKINQHAFSPVDTNNSLTENPRATSGGDAVYVYNMNLLPENERSERALKAALLLTHKGYLSISHYLLSTFTKMNANEIDTIFSALNRKSANELRKNSARKWLPPAIIGWLKKG